MRTARLARAVRGALSGVVATIPMSVLMAGSAALGVLPTPSPPHRIVRHLAPVLDDGASDLVTAATHAAYGAGAGALLALLPIRQGPLAGAAFGFGVWATGYEGWVPLLGALPPAHRDDRGRVATMIAAHLVWGAALGALGALTRRRPQRP